MGFDEFGAFLEESWSAIDQMMDISSKFYCWPKTWSLNVYGPQLTLDLVQLIFQHLSNWLGKLLVQGMKLHMSILMDILRTMKTTWDLRNPNFFVKDETLVVIPLLRRRICLTNSWTTLSIWETLENVLKKNGRKNFRVQQLPLFNIFKPEELY